EHRLGEPRPRHVRGPRPARPRARPEPAPRVRVRHALLPRGAARAARGAARVRRADAAVPGALARGGPAGVPGESGAPRAHEPGRGGVGATPLAIAGRHASRLIARQRNSFDVRLGVKWPQVEILAPRTANLISATQPAARSLRLVAYWRGCK